MCVSTSLSRFLSRYVMHSSVSYWQLHACTCGFIGVLFCWESFGVHSKKYTIWKIIIKRISRARIYHTRWQHKALYNNTNHTHACTRTHTVSDEEMGRAVKNGSEIMIK